jgi:signal transduction histidine kinase
LEDIKKRVPFRRKPVIGLFATVVFSSLLLIAINFFTIKIMSATRSYINGESHYTKGEKDATRNLVIYLHTRDSLEWQSFRRNLEVPLSDSRARVLLLEKGNSDSIRKELLGGYNHSDDLDNMIWLFENFQHVIMKEPIEIWTTADSIIYQKKAIGEEIHRLVTTHTLQPGQIPLFLEKLNENTMVLTRLEKAFSGSLGTAARSLESYLFYANLFIVFLILGNFTAYVLSTIRQLKQKNEDLVRVNEELDRFVYGLSHDLKAPITSLSGLVNLARTDTNPKNMEEYLSMMQFALDKQEKFIKGIVNFSQNKWARAEQQKINFADMVDQVIAIHKFMPAAAGIRFEKKIGASSIYCDAIRLEIVLNNLVSNAIKYHDPEKENRFISIASSIIDRCIIIEVQDNGLGIDEESQPKIFDMFYGSKGRGSGLGLYIVSETIAKMNGRIKVTSLKGVGSTFTITLPIS